MPNLQDYFTLRQQALTNRKLNLYNLHKEGKISDDEFRTASQEILDDQIALTREERMYFPTY